MVPSTPPSKIPPTVTTPIIVAYMTLLCHSQTSFRVTPVSTIMSVQTTDAKTENAMDTRLMKAATITPIVTSDFFADKRISAKLKKSCGVSESKTSTVKTS